MKKIYMLVVSFTLSVSVVLVPAVTQAVSQLYITGVQNSGGPGHTTDDFVELYNPNAAALNLKDFKLVKRTAQGTADTVLKSWNEDTFIPAYSFYLWANSNFSSITGTPDVTSSGSVADDNGVGLRFGSVDTGQLINSIAWGQTNNGFATVMGNFPAGSVLQRQDIFGALSSYDNVLGVVPRNSSVQQLPPGVTLPPPQEDPPPIIVPPEDPPVSDPPPVEDPPIVVDPPVLDPPEIIVYLPLDITEILPNPAGSDEGQEAVEIYNPNSVAVDVSGWYLGDGLGSLPASNAYQLSGTIAAGQYKSFVTPAGKFTLNNTGGDSVQLFSPDKQIVDSVTYSGTAGENKSFQKLGSDWLWLDSSLGLANIEPVGEEGEEIEEEGEDEAENNIVYGGITITEFYPAFGLGAGMPAVPSLEVVNHTDKEINLSEWQVDVVSTHLKKPSDNSFVVTDTNTVQPGGLGTIEISNINSNDFEPSGKYWVIVYSPDGKSQDAVNIKSIVSRLSYAKVGTLGWEWAEWSPLAENKPLAAPNIQFSEVLPSYKDAETEAFVELQNQATEPAYLGNLKIKIGAKSVWLPDYMLQPQEYYAISAEDLPAALTAAGKKVFLTDANDKEIALASYLKGKDGLAFMLQPDGKWAWTAEPTPASANVWQPAENSTVKKAVAAKAAAKPAAKPVAVKPVAAANTSSLPAEEAQSQPKKSKKPVWVFGLVGALLLGAAAVVWFVAKEPESEEVS